MSKNKRVFEKQILDAIKKGDTNSKTFEFFYLSCFPKVKALVLRGNGNEEEARDIFQDAVLTFYRKVKLDKYEHYTEIDAYIYTICRNEWYKRAKNKKRTSEITEVTHASYTDYSSPETMFFTTEKQAWVMDLLSQVGERCKELMIKKVYHNLSLTEICEKMGFSTTQAAKTKVYKCKQRLIKLLKDNQHIKEIYYND